MNKVIKDYGNVTDYGVKEDNGSVDVARETTQYGVVLNERIWNAHVRKKRFLLFNFIGKLRLAQVACRR